MFRGLLGSGSSSASPQSSGSNNRRKEVLPVSDYLHELYKPQGTPTLQVLFFHGLRSGDLSDAHISTWKSEDDSCIWPQEWLPDIFPGAQIFTVSYGECANFFDMYLLGENLVSDLLQSGIGQITSCPVILVGHCVGGLVIKEICCQAHDQLKLDSNIAPLKKKLRTFLGNIRGIFYYSTPHHGSSIIAIAAEGQLFQFFRILNAITQRLNFKFDRVRPEYKWLIFGLGECLPTTSWRGFWNCLGNILFNHSNEVEVPEASSRQGSHFRIVVADHNSICQPRSKIDTRFSHLKNLIDTIAVELEEEAQVHQERQEAQHQNFEQVPDVILTHPTTILDNDRFYVPIQSSHNAVIAEIEKLGGAHVILVYGGVGKGKSTLARYMYAHYGEDGKNGKLFEHVIWLSCANCSKDGARTKQYEVLSEHSPNTLGDTLSQEKTLLNRRIAKAFQNFVCDKKILIILDDVSDYIFLYEMWEVVKRATHVKYLVTSQRSDICNSLKNDSICIAMGDPTEEESKAILASHVFLQQKVIPNHLQDIAKHIIEITEGNPLALACLASRFAYNQDNEDKQVWQDAYTALQELLNRPAVNIVMGNIGSTSRSLWAAMRSCIESLDSIDAKNLLSFIYACKGELVPEVVLRVWMKISRSSFMQSLGELSMRELVRRNSGTMAANTTDMHGMGQNNVRQQLTSQLTGTMWSLRSLVKLYMQQDKVAKGTVRSLIDGLIGNEESSSDLTLGCEGPCETEEINSEKRRVAVALCALYFDRQHLDSTHAISRAGISSNARIFYDNVHDLRQKAMEPSIWMLVKPIEEGKWTHSDVHCVRKVLLTYICSRQLDDESISHLLTLDACTQAQLAILKVIGDICFIEEKPLFSKITLHFLQEIVHLLHLKEGFPTPVQQEASRTLLIICWKAQEENSSLRILDTPGVLHILVSLLASTQPSDLIRAHGTMALAILSYGKSVLTTSRISNEEGALVRLVNLLTSNHNYLLLEPATRVLHNLAGRGDNDLKLRIANEGAVVGLVKCLALSNHPDLQEMAAHTLAKLAQMDPIRWTIAKEEGALNGLVKLLFADNKPKVQITAVNALQYLSVTKDINLLLRIVTEKGAVVGLVRCLALSNGPELQEQTANTLANLAHTDSIRCTIANEQGALDALVKLLLVDNMPGVQIGAVRALQNLSATEDNFAKQCIANQEGLMASLVKCLASSNGPDLQEQTAHTLANLTHTDRVRWTIANEQGALDALVNLLLAGNMPGVHIGAARVLLNLSSTKDNSIKLSIVNQEGLMASLVTCLALSNRPDLQAHTANTLANLAHTDPVRWTIANEEGALNGLVKLLFVDNKPMVQIAAAGALQNLSATKDNDLQLCIVNLEGALNGLVKLLLANNMPGVQIAAVQALLSLSDTKDNFVALRIANQEGLMASLVKCLALSSGPGVQEKIAEILAHLAHTDPVRWSIANEEGALNGLVKLLFVCEKPNMQRAAARAIGNLSCTTDNLLQLRIGEEEGTLESLMICAFADDHPELQEYATMALACLACTKPIQTYFLNEEGALGRFVNLLSAQQRPTLQKHAALVFYNLAGADNNFLKLRIANEEGAIAGLVKCLALDNCPFSQHRAAWSLCYLADLEEAKAILEGTEGLVMGLSSLLADGIPPETQYIGARALTFINPTKGREATLTSAQAYGGRAYAFICMRMYTEALPDLDRTVDLLNGAGAEIFCLRCFVKSKLGDLKGALDDANKAVNVSDSNYHKPFALQERGVLKRMMGDLDGALADLDEGLELEADDYERLKHRGYVKFLLGDEDGARTDAEWALRIKPPRVDRQDYTKGQFLGVSPVEYMGYKLK